MKKISIMFLSTIFIVCLSINVHGQFLKIGVGGGITNITGPDEFTKEVSDGGLGFSTEYNIGLVGKIDLPLIPLTPRGLIIYHNLGGEGSQIPVLPKVSNATDINVEYSQSILSLGLGVQYSFIPVPIGFDPYVAVDLMYNNFGEFTTTTDGNEVTAEGVSRTGLQFGIGTEISLIPTLNLDVFAAYNLFNVAGKEDGEETITAITLDIFVMFNFL